MQSTVSDYVRRHDRDHFICSLFVSKSIRRSYLALYAFNIEINNIIYDCSEAMTALVRLKWWREKVDMIYHNKTPNDNQVLFELINLIHSTGMAESLINDYLDGYEEIVFQISHKDVDDLEKIAAQTTVNLIRMLFAISVKDYSNNELAHHCGVAWHLMNSLRNGCNRITEQLSKEKVILIVERAEYHIGQVKKLIKTAPKEIARITLQVRLANLYLKHIRNRKFDIISKEIGTISPIMQIKMLFYYLIDIKCFTTNIRPLA